MMMKTGNSRKIIEENVKTLVKEGHTYLTAIGMAYTFANENPVAETKAPITPPKPEPLPEVDKKVDTISAEPPAEKLPYPRKLGIQSLLPEKKGPGRPKSLKPPPAAEVPTFYKGRGRPRKTDRL